jgi:hypothetical protein
MTSRSAAASETRWARRETSAAAAWQSPDARRWLQLGLAAIWLLDGVLQYQSFMFTKAFGLMLAESGAGNPPALAESISWAARIVEHNPATTNAAFATIQLALGLGIAWRRTIKLALAGSVVWSVAVWWFGEGLGGVLTGGASPVTGAPGAVILYALLAVLLWPAASGGPGSFVAARPIGARAARLVWLVLWGSLAYFALLPGNRTAQGLRDTVAGMAAGEPSWMASVNRSAAGLLAGRGLAVSIVLAVVLAAIAVGVFLPGPAVRVTLVLAAAVSAVIWIVGQDLGAILAGNETDVNSGPLLVLVALAYWPLYGVRPGPAATMAGPAAEVADRGVPAAGVPAGQGATR